MLRLNFKVKKLLISLFLLFGLLFSISPSFAENFYIKDYKVKMHVSKDRNIDVKEELQVYFTNYSHGIIRDIPKKGRDEIQNIEATDMVNYECTPRLCSVKVGDPYERITGDKTYNFSYKYKIKSNKNEFYYNIIGTDWDTNINKVEFEIEMPAQFDRNKLGISIGKYGTRGFQDGAYFKVDNTTISGATTKPLGPNEGITLRLEVPQEYFAKQTDYSLPIALMILIVSATTSFFLWFTCGKDDEVIPVVNFSAPEGINPIEAQIVFNEKADKEGLIALIVYLANKGYIRINTNNGPFAFTKLKDFDDLEYEEREFAEALFEGKTNVKQNDLTYSQTFYKKCTEIISKYNAKKNKVFEESSISFGSKAIAVICILVCFLATIAILFDFNTNILNSNIILCIMFPMIACCILVQGLVQKGNIFGKIYTVVFALLLGGVPLLAVLNSSGAEIELKNMWYVAFGIACTIACGIFSYLLPKRNREGNRIQGELLGLKQFIEVAEKHRLEAMVKENPSYFYSILPYAYILGVSDVWIKQFEDIMADKPEYKRYYINTASFDRMANSFTTCTLPSSQNGGISTSSSGGGGFSGGGCGGGGGHSW